MENNNLFKMKKNQFWNCSIRFFLLSSIYLFPVQYFFEKSFAITSKKQNGQFSYVRGFVNTFSYPKLLQFKFLWFKAFLLDQVLSWPHGTMPTALKNLFARILSFNIFAVTWYQQALVTRYCSVTDDMQQFEISLNELWLCCIKAFVGVSLLTISICI